MSSSNIFKKKLLFVISSLGGGGAERVMVHLINHLDKNRYDILLVIFEEILDYQKDFGSTPEIICLDKTNRWHFFKIILKLRKIITHFQPNVVMSFLGYTNIVTVLASLFFTRRKFDLILSERSYPPKSSPTAHFDLLGRMLRIFAYRRADMIVCNSNHTKSAIEKDFHIRSEKVKTIYNPVTLQEIRAKAQERVTHSFFQNEGAKVIIGVGRLAEAKRFDRLLRAFSLVRREEENVRLIIVGKGRLQRELEDLASQLKISEWVDFVGFQSNPYAWISKSDILVLSSDFEGLPNVLLEAMACGVPVVSTDCLTGPSEIITNGKNGILVPVSDEKELTEAVLTLLKDEGLRRRFSIEGRKRAEDFRVEKIIPQYEKLFWNTNSLNL